MFEQAFAVIVVLLLMAGTFWFLRSRGMARFNMPSKSGRGVTLEVVSRLHLTPQHSVQVVRVGSRNVVLVLSPGGCQSIGELAAAELGNGSTAPGSVR